MHSVGEGWMWLVFFGFVLAILAIDMVVLGGRKSHRVTLREAAVRSVVWIFCAMVFGGLLWWYLNLTSGSILADQKALEFFTGFIIEKSLSVDNLFVFLMIFTYFKVPLEYQRRILLYGVWGAIILRLLLIAGGAALASEFHWVLYIFGLFLLATSVRMLFADDEKDLAKSPLVKWLSKHLRVTNKSHREKFFVKQNKILYATPLFIVLILIEVSDLIFALDSIPAIFAITLDTFIIFTSNIFAIMGLRALYFLLADLTYRFHLLKYGIALLLAFVGIKMLIEPWYDVSTPVTLLIVAVILTTTVILSLLVPASQQPKR